MLKPIVICDVDNVILEWTRAFLEFMNKRLGMDMRYEDSTSHDLAESTGVDRDLIIALALEYDRQCCSKELPIIPGSLDSLRLIQERYDIVLATSCGVYYEEPRRNFFARELPGVPIHFTSGKANDFSGVRERPNKLMVARAVGADVFIDDNEKEFELWDSDIALPICYAQPWNRSLETTHPEIPRLTWPEIVDLLMNERPVLVPSIWIA